jgi:orotate phosphoribosyltransferase
VSELSRKLRDHDVIIYEPVVLRGGEVSHYYADIKKAYGNPELLDKLARATVENLDQKTTCLAASGYGGLPLGVAASRISGLPLAMVRDAHKNHGKQELIDGYVPGTGDNVSVVDDVFTSGSSLTQTISTLEATGAEIIRCHVILARGATEEFRYPISYLLSSDELL